VFAGGWHCSDRQYSDRHCSDRDCSDRQYSSMALSHLRDYLIINFWFLFIKQMFTITSFALLPICWNYFVSTKSIRYFSIRHNQWQRKQFESGGADGERGARAYKGVWGRSPQRGPEAEPPWSWKILGRKDSKYLHLYPTFESAEISPKHCLESK